MDYFESEELDLELDEEALESEELGFDSVDEVEAGVELAPESELPDDFVDAESLFWEEPFSADFPPPLFP